MIKIRLWKKNSLHARRRAILENKFCNKVLAWCVSKTLYLKLHLLLDLKNQIIPIIFIQIVVEIKVRFKLD